MEGRRNDALKRTAEKANLRHDGRGLAAQGVSKLPDAGLLPAFLARLVIFTSYSPFGRYVCCRRQIFRAIHSESQPRLMGLDNEVNPWHFSPNCRAVRTPPYSSTSDHCSPTRVLKATPIAPEKYK